MLSAKALLHRYASVTAVATFLLLIAGGMVTSTDSGLAVPDWPLSHGQFFPPMVGGIFYEHGHRMIAAVVGLMILVLAIWVGRSEPRRWVRRLAYAAFAAVVIQALLGGLTVLLLLPPEISIAHACLGQAVFCLVVCVAYATGPMVAQPLAPDDGSLCWLRRLSLTAALAAAAQLVLGAIIRHTGRAIPLHVAGAVAVALGAACLAALAARQRRELPRLWGHAWRLFALVVIQIGIGFTVLFLQANVVTRTGHVALGALVLAQAILLAWDARRQPGARHFLHVTYLAPYVELTKPRVTVLVLVTTVAGFWLGADGAVHVWPLVSLLLGTALVAGGANALNQWMEREPDGLMDRTKQRPLPSGRLAPDAAFRFGAGLAMAGLGLLIAAGMVLSAGLALLTFASYLFLYTPLKRITSLCTLAGAIPGALPPLIGWAAARHALGPEAWALFGLLFVWQLPHFLAIAVLYRDDYARAGFKMLPVTEPDGASTARQTALYGLALLPLSLLPTTIGLAGTWYFCGALILSLAFVAVSAQAAWCRSAHSARQLFRASILYLPLLLALLVCDRGVL